MTIKEMYTEAMKRELEWFCIFIEFLIFEKNIITFEDDKSVLDLYFKPNNHDRMNELLMEYRERLGR